MNGRVAVLVGSLFISAIALNSHAADRNWLGTFDQSWTNPGNWSDSLIPIAGDTAVFETSDEQIIRIDSTVSVGTMIGSGSRVPPVRHTFVGDGSIIIDGPESMIRGDAFQFDVPIELRNDAAFLVRFRESPLLFTEDITIGPHHLRIRDSMTFSDLTIRGTGSVEIERGTLTASGAFEGDVSTRFGYLAPDPSLGIGGNADIEVELEVFDETRFDTVNGGGVGTLEVGLLRVQMGQFPDTDLIGKEFQIFSGWESITVSELELPVIGEWDTSRLNEGILKVADVDDVPKCDRNLSGNCDIDDLDIIGNAVRESTDDFRADVNGDSLIDLQDRDEWLVLAGFLLGDANLDGSVNAVDLMSLGQNWQSTDATSWNHADFNMDGVVNARDLNDLGRNWQKALVAAANPLPEPATYLSLMLGGILFLKWFRHQSSRAAFLGLLLIIGAWIANQECYADHPIISRMSDKSSSLAIYPSAPDVGDI